MGVSIRSQLWEVALSLALGLAAGVLYDIFRVARRSLKSRVVTVLLDGLFWLGAFFGLFSLGLSAGEGRQRIYSQVLAALGAILYFLTVSRYVVALGDVIAAFLARVAAFLLLPVKYLEKILKKFWGISKKCFSYLKKRFKIMRKRKPADPPEEVPSHEGKAFKYAYENSPGGAAPLRSGDAVHHRRAQGRRRGAAGGG